MTTWSLIYTSRSCLILSCLRLAGVGYDFTGYAKQKGSIWLKICSLGLCLKIYIYGCVKIEFGASGLLS